MARPPTINIEGIMVLGLVVSYPLVSAGLIGFWAKSVESLECSSEGKKWALEQFMLDAFRRGYFYLRGLLVERGPLVGIDEHVHELWDLIRLNGTHGKEVINRVKGHTPSIHRANIHQHLKRLARLKLVERRRRGYYSVIGA